jgi:hypothetical protein
MIQKEIPYAKIKYDAILFFLFTILLFVFSACQEESEEIITPPSDRVIIPNSTVANLIGRIALKDGSSDNIVDNSSCISLVLPVTVLVNGQEIKINSEDDFKIVERIFDEFENDDDTLNMIFPVTVIRADHTEFIINHEEDLEDIIEKCTEGGNDDDIECVDFQYPLTLSVYDSNTQLSNTVTIHNDQELYKFFDALEEGEFVSFKFPLIVVLPGAQKITINNNDQLKDVIENAIGECDEDDDNDFNDDDVDDSGLIAVLTDGMWKITYFFDKTDETHAFTDFMFTFKADGTALATNGTSSVNGTWKSYGDSGTLELEFDFGNEAPFKDIGDDWELVEFSTTIIKLQDVSGGDDSVSALTFEKI